MLEVDGDEFGRGVSSSQGRAEEEAAKDAIQTLGMLGSIEPSLLPYKTEVGFNQHRQVFFLPISLGNATAFFLSYGDISKRMVCQTGLLSTHHDRFKRMISQHEHMPAM